MRYEDDGKSSQHENSAGSSLAELGFDIVGEFLPDSFIGYIVLILAAVFVWVIRSGMNE
jgi:hypothetical protein